MNPDDAAKLIQQKLFDAPGIVDEELISACEGLIGIDPVGKRVNFKVSGLTDKERIVLYALGMRLLSYAIKDPECAEVGRQQLAEELRMKPNLVAAYASKLINIPPKPLRNSRRGQYEVWLPVMKAYIGEIKARIVNQGK